MEKPNKISLVELNETSSSSPSHPLFSEKQKGISPKQLTWFILLKFHKAFIFLQWLSMGFKSMFISAKKRVSLLETEEEEPRNRGRVLYRVIKLFLFISIIGLVLELFAHFMNLNYQNPFEIQSVVEWFYLSWVSFRVEYIAPLILSLSQFCIALFLIQSLDRLILCLGCFWIKYKNHKPEIHSSEPYFPKVLVQIPMCNEREVSPPLFSPVFFALFYGI